MYVCKHACMYVTMYVRMYVWKEGRLDGWMHVCVQMEKNACVHARIVAPQFFVSFKRHWPFDSYMTVQDACMGNQTRNLKYAAPQLAPPPKWLHISIVTTHGSEQTEQD